jgi:hypothetical protein
MIEPLENLLVLTDIFKLSRNPKFGMRILSPVPLRES